MLHVAGPHRGGQAELAAAGAGEVFLMMTLFASDGPPKLVPECSYPVTGLASVSRLCTDWALFHLGAGGVTMAETHGMSVGELAARLDLTMRRLGERQIPAPASWPQASSAQGSCLITRPVAWSNRPRVDHQELHRFPPCQVKPGPPG
jgi:hypothetical protein